MNNILPKILILEKEIEIFDKNWNHQRSLIEYWLLTESTRNKINELKYLNLKKINRNEKK
jgi:hypothetical protein